MAAACARARTGSFKKSKSFSGRAGAAAGRDGAGASSASRSKSVANSAAAPVDRALGTATGWLLPSASFRSSKVPAAWVGRSPGGGVAATAKPASRSMSLGVLVRLTEARAAGAALSCAAGAGALAAPPSRPERGALGLAFGRKHLQ